MVHLSGLDECLVPLTVTKRHLVPSDALMMVIRFGGEFISIHMPGRGTFFPVESCQEQ